MEEDVVFKSLGEFQLGSVGRSFSLPVFGWSESSTSTLVAARYTARCEAPSRTSAAARKLERESCSVRLCFGSCIVFFFFVAVFV